MPRDAQKKGTSVTPHLELLELARHLRAELIGDGSVVISGLASVHSAAAGDLVFVEADKHFAPALTSRAAAVIVARSTRIPAGTSKPVLLVDHPRLAFARAAELLKTMGPRVSAIHPAAVVDPSAKVSADVCIDAHACIEANAAIGEGTWIGAGCIIGEAVHIGRDCRIFPRVTIYPGATIGNNVTVHAGAVLGSDGFGYVKDPAGGEYVPFPQVGTLRIEDNVDIGANSTIDRGALDSTRIGRGTRIDNLVHVGHNVQIGERVVIAAQTGISGSAVIEDDAVIAGQVGIADHVRIEAGAILGAQSGIPSHKVIRGRGVVFWGTPARPLKDYLKQLAALSRLARGKD